MNFFRFFSCKFCLFKPWCEIRLFLNNKFAYSFVADLTTENLLKNWQDRHFKLAKKINWGFQQVLCFGL